MDASSLFCCGHTCGYGVEVKPKAYAAPHSPPRYSLGVISRRALLGTSTSVAVVAGAAVCADRTHRLDDFFRRIGVDPLRQPAESDRAIVVRARRAQSDLLLTTRSASERFPTLTSTLQPLATNLERQLAELGGPDTAARPRDLPGAAQAALAAVTAQFDTVCSSCEREVGAAVSVEFAQLLAAIAAGLAQSLAILTKAAK